MRLLTFYLLNRGGNRRAFILPGEGGDHFHCTVETSPGHIWCRLSPASSKPTRICTASFEQVKRRRSSPVRGYKFGCVVPIWLVLPRCEATNLGVFNLCDFALLKTGLCKFGGGFLELAKG